MDAEKSSHKKIKVTKKVREAVELLKDKITSAQKNSIPERLTRHLTRKGESLRLPPLHGNREQVLKQERRTPGIRLGVPKA